MPATPLYQVLDTPRGLSESCTLSPGLQGEALQLLRVAQARVERSPAVAATFTLHLARLVASTPNMARDFLARLQGDLAPSQSEDSPSVFETEYLPSLDPAREQQAYSFTTATRYEILDGGEPGEETEAVVVSLLSLAGSLQSLPRTTEIGRASCRERV